MGGSKLKMGFTNNANEDILTTLVRIKGAECKVVSVKSSKPIDKSIWIECSKCLSGLYVGAPIKIGDVVCNNILNTGADMVSTKNVSKKDSDKVIKY
jgi:CxxC motif-containing protein